MRFSAKQIFSVFLVAFFYMLIVLYVMNFRLIDQTIFGTFSLNYKFTLIYDLLGGFFTAMTPQSFLLSLVVAILTGINFVLLFDRVKLLGNKKLKLVVGGSSLLGIIGSGCASCGMPLISLLGLSASIGYLPFRGLEVSMLAILILSISIFQLIKTYPNTNAYCAIN